MNYEFLDHTADAKFRAYGSNIEISFCNAALAMFSLLIEPEKVKTNLTKKINIKSKKKESLLYDFLEELLFLLDTEGFLLHDVKDLKIKFFENSFFLTCKVMGDHASNYKDIHGNIKSITYNDMIITENFSSIPDKKIMLQVVLDL